MTTQHLGMGNQIRSHRGSWLNVEQVPQREDSGELLKRTRAPQLYRPGYRDPQYCPLSTTTVIRTNRRLGKDTWDTSVLVDEPIHTDSCISKVQRIIFVDKFSLFYILYISTVWRALNPWQPQIFLILSPGSRKRT